MKGDRVRRQKTLYLEEELDDRIVALAESEERSWNKQVEWLLKRALTPPVENLHLAPEYVQVFEAQRPDLSRPARPDPRPGKK